jgi:hypothetical protein
MFALTCALHTKIAFDYGENMEALCEGCGFYGMTGWGWFLKARDAL